MRTTATSIDLGELPRGGSEADTAGERRPDPRQRYGGAGAPARHRWPALAVAAGLALTTAGAAGPPPVWATLQFTVPAGGQVVLTDRHLYLIDETDQRQGMSAHRLTDGSTEWTLTHRTTEDWFTVRGDLPFEISATVVSAGESEWFSYTERTTAFDPDTGEPRWTLAGDLIFPGAGVGALTRHRSLPDQSSWRRELTIVDLATGRELWTTPPFVNWSYPLDDPDLVRQLVTLTEDGELTSYDLATGARLATTRTAAERVEERQVQVVGSLVLLQGPARDTLTAYDLATLRRRWTADLPPGGFLVVSACEPVLCVQGGAVPLALDPATGAAAWSADWLPESGVAGDTWVAQPGPPWPTGLLLVEGWVVEAATGEPVLELREWAPLGGDEPILGRPAALLTRYELPAGPGDAGRTWFGRIRSDPVRLEVLGGVDGRLHRCVTSADQLACQRDDELLVWRLRG